MNANRTQSIRRPLTGALLFALGLSLGGMLALAGPGGHRGGHAAFAKMDTNADGQLTKAEAESFRRARQNGLDANLDGIVSFEEAKAFRQAQAEQRARQRYARMDKDGDGQVSLAEFNARSDRWFDRVDANDDGVISAEERDAAKERHRGKRHERHRQR